MILRFETQINYKTLNINYLIATNFRGKTFSQI